MKYLFFNIIIFCSLISVMNSCSNKSEIKAQDSKISGIINTDSTADASCPFITTDAAGNTVICWVQQSANEDEEALMYYRILDKNAKDFSEPIVIPTSRGVQPHDENLAKMILKKNGEIIAVFGKSNPNPENKYSGQVFYTQSFDKGKNWSVAKPLVTDTSSYDQRYFDLTILPDGEAGIIWLDSRLKNGREGSTLFFARTKGKLGFINETAVAETICQCCRTKLFTDAKGNLHAAFRDIINDSIRDMVHIVSADGGKTFSEPKRISPDNWVINGCPHTGPAMVQNNKGLHFAWYTMGGGEGVFYCNSKDNGASYSNRKSVSNNSSAKHPQIATFANGNLALVWDELNENQENSIHQLGLQLRDSEGKIINTKIISAANENATFPVLRTFDNSSTLLVAYTVKKNKKQSISWQKLDL